jgi:hypothetical protein
VVTQVEGEVGQVVGAGQAVLTFADPSRPEVAVSLSEGGLGPVQRAKRLSVTLWSDPSRKYAVKLRSIAGAADPATRTFAARFSIIAPGETLRMGETAELRIEDERVASGILVPLTAIAQGHDAQGHDKAQAWVVDRRTMTVQPRTVKVGQASGDKLTVLSGLRPARRSSPPASTCCVPAKRSASPRCLPRDLQPLALGARPPAARRVPARRRLGGGAALVPFARAQGRPEFTVKTMMITVGWPGATADQMAEQVIKPIETVLTENIPDIDYVKSKARPGGDAQRHADLHGQGQRGAGHLVHRAQDRDGPPRTCPTTSSVLHSTTSSGRLTATSTRSPAPASPIPLKRYAETLRDRIQALPDVAKTEVIGAQDEAVYVTYDSARLAMLGISSQAIADALDGTNAVSASGTVDAGAERVRLQVAGAYGSLEAIAATPIFANGRGVRLDAIAKSSARPRTPPPSGCGSAARTRWAWASACATTATSPGWAEPEADRGFVSGRTAGRRRNPVSDQTKVVDDPSESSPARCSRRW